MRGRPLVRAVLVVVLLAAVGWQLVDYAAHVDEQSVYPTERELDAGFQRYHGQAIETWVTVAERTDEGFRATNGWTIRVSGNVTLPPRLDRGDSVQVYGIARPGQTVEARRLALADGTNRAYMLAVSTVGLLLAVGATLRHWRPSIKQGYVVPRTTDGEAPGGPADGVGPGESTDGGEHD